MAAARILLVSSTFPPVTGGSAIVYENLARLAGGAVVALGAARDYATGEPFAGVEAYDKAAGYPIYRMPLLRALNVRPRGPLAALRSKAGDAALMARLLLRVLSIARRERIDVVCLGDLVYGGWLAFPLKALGYKVVVYVHGEEITTRGGGGVFEAWRARFLARADAVVSVSRFTRDAMVRLMGVDPARIVLIPNGVDLARFRVRAPSPEAARRYGVENRRVILSVGRLVPRKGADRLVEAMARVVEACPDVHLLVAGEGVLAPALADLVRTHGLEDRVSLLGGVSDAALAELYALADVFAMPNREMPDGDTEGFGLVFLEANASGKAVVAGRAGGAADAVTDGVNGLTVEGDDVEAIATALVRLLDDPELRERLARKGLEIAAASDWRSRTDDFLALCDALAAGTFKGAAIP